MLLMLSAQALAGQPDLSPLLDGAAPPDVVVTCAPIQEVERLLANLPPAPDSAIPQLLASAGSFGADPEGRLSVALWRETGAGRVMMDFSGELEQVVPLVESLWGEPVERLPDALQSSKGVARLSDGALLILDSTVPSGAGGRPALLEGLISDSACGIAVDGLTLPKTPIVAVGVSIPLGRSEQLAVRLRTKEDSLPTMRVDGPPIGGSSTQRPLGVLVLSAEPLALLAHPPIMETMGLTAGELERISEKLSISPGLTMAIFGDPQAPTYAWTMGVTRPGGRPLSARKLMRYTRRLLEDEGRAWERLSRRQIRLTMEDGDILIAASAGRIALGTAQLEAGEAAAGAGEPWLSEELTAQAAQWPISAIIDPPQMPVSALLGARMSGDTVEASLRIDGLAQTLQMAMGMLPMALEEVQSRSRLARLSQDMEALLAAEQAHRERTGAWRLLEAGESWADFSPAVTGATYWTQASPDGSVEVHGQIDADGDGRAAHYMLDTAERFWTLTSEGVR
jgi:hypothetical protein